jgi:protein involved in polysaccharide export with SLBB domain
MVFGSGAIALFLATAAAAQLPSSSGSVPRGSSASRASLEAQARAAGDSASASAVSANVRSEQLARAEAIRARLARGDFNVGDRIALTVDGEKTLTDTFTVRSGVELELPNLGSVPLQGVLYSELQPRLESALARYLRDPRVTAVPLIRIAVTGSVARSGWIYVRADMLASDVIMTAGGPSSEADLNRVRIRRGEADVVGIDAMRAGLAHGQSLDELGVQSGDQLIVEKRKSFSWGPVLQGATVLLGLTATILTLRR